MSAMHKSELQAQNKSQKNKLCAWRHNMPCPARCTHAVAHLQSIAYMPVAPSAPCATNIHDWQAAARFGQWRRNWSWRYILCSDLNSQPKWSGDLDLWPFDPKSGVRVTCDVGYLCANFSLPRPLWFRVRPNVRDRQTEFGQKHCLLPPSIRHNNSKRTVWHWMVLFVL